MVNWCCRYYYDTETGFYYLQTRYYDPAICRFINADGQINSGLLGLNLFSYCENNPASFVDYNGRSFRDNLKQFGENCLKAAIVVSSIGVVVLACAGTIASGGAGAAAIPIALSLASEALIYSSTATVAIGVISYAIGSSDGSSSPRSPNGRKGSKAHQDKISEQTGKYSSDQVKYEVKIDTPNGRKSCRFADFSVTDGKTTWFGQVGKALKTGLPCARERQAIEDILEALGDVIIIFFPYNT